MCCGVQVEVLEGDIPEILEFQNKFLQGLEVRAPNPSSKVTIVMASLDHSWEREGPVVFNW